VVRNFEIIGEAVKNLSRDLKKRYNDIEWKDIAGMRDNIIHHYFGIKWDIVWSAVKDKLPELKDKIEKKLRVEKKLRDEKKLRVGKKLRDESLGMILDVGCWIFDIRC
jgi:uncharacterized protein with HEPN domain